MGHYTPWIALPIFLALAPSIAARADGHGDGAQPTSVITVRPSMLAQQVSDLAGQKVRVPYARVVGVFEPRVFVIETATPLPSLLGFRDRVVVLIHPGALRVPATALVASTVTVVGVARTVLGVQVTGEVPWPAVLSRDAVERLEIRAAVLATSVQTAEGVELTDESSSPVRQRFFKLPGDLGPTRAMRLDPRRGQAPMRDD